MAEEALFLCTELCSANDFRYVQCGYALIRVLCIIKVLKISISMLLLRLMTTIKRVVVVALNHLYLQITNYLKNAPFKNLSLQFPLKLLEQ